MSNLMKNLKKDGFRASKNSFSQDYYNTFSAKLNQLLPAFCLHTVPQGYYEIDVRDITETALMSTKAFAGMTVNLDFYFVPYTALWSLFNQFHVGRADRQDAHFTGSVPSYVPTIDLRRLLDVISRPGISYNNKGNLDWFGHRPLGGFRLLDLLDYGYYVKHYLQQSSQGSFPAEGFKRVNLFAAQAYQCIWYYYYRNKFYDNDVPPSIFNMDDVGFNIKNQNDGELELERLFDDTRIQSMFTLRYCQKKKDLFSSVLPSASFGSVHVVNFTSSTSVNGTASLSGTTGLDGDYFVPSASPNTVPTVRQLENTHIQSGLIQNASGELTFVSPLLDGEGGNEMLRGIHHSHPVTGTASLSSSGTSVGSINVLDIARSEALQKWAYTTLRQGNDTREQMIGHHGVAPHFDPHVMPQYLGSYDSVVNINKVDVTADGGDLKAGQYVGQGFSNLSGNTIKFQASDFGIIMAVYSVRPDLQHPAIGLDKNHTLRSQFDFFTPELDNTGLVPVTQSELDINISGSTGKELTIGFAPQHYNLKTKVHKAHGEFIFSPESRGLFSQFVLSDLDPQLNDLDSGSRRVFTLYGSPLEANAIFVPQAVEARGDDDVQEAESAGLQEATDIFYPNFYFNVRTLLPMSKLGLPQF